MSYFKAKMHHEFDLGWGSAPDHTLRELTVLAQIP